MPNSPSPFGEVLRRYRQAANLSQQALAERAKLSRDAIAALERGRRHPRLATISTLANALRLSAADHIALNTAAARSPETNASKPAKTVIGPAAGLPVYFLEIEIVNGSTSTDGNFQIVTVEKEVL